MPGTDGPSVLIVRQIDQPHSVGFLAVGPNLGAEGSRGGDGLVLLLQVTFGKQNEQLFEGFHTELGFDTIRPGREPAPVNRRRMGDEPIGDVLRSACRTHRGFTPVA